MSKHQWTEEETDRFKRIYNNSTNDELRVSFPWASDYSLWSKACHLGLSKDKEILLDKRYVETKLVKLLDDSPEAAYWFGFLIADGYFSNKRLEIEVARVDLKHLKVLSTYLETSNIHLVKNNTQARLTIIDRHVIPKIRQKFGIKDKKTYNPLEKLPYLSGELLCCFLAGLIDGDGHVSSNQSFKRITIKVHKNWLRFFNSLSLAIAKYFGENKFGKTYLTSNSYCAFELADQIQLTWFKRLLVNNKLPLMKRKWDKIDEGRICVGCKERKKIVISMLEEGYSEKEIIDIGGFSKKYVQGVKNGIKNE